MKPILALFLLIICYTANAGTGKPVANKPGQTTADTDSVVRKQSLSIGVSYGSDIIFFGRTSQHKFPYLTGDFVYNTKSGFFVYTSVVNITNLTPAFNEVDFGAGYIFRPSSKFSITPSYTRFVFNKDAPIIKSTSSNDIDLKNTYDFKIVKSSIIVDYLFGRTSDIFVTISNTHHFESNFSIFNDNDYLTFDPAFNVILGTQNFVESYDDDFHNKHYGFPPRYQSDGDRNAARVFDGLNYSFKIPIAYNMPHYTFELAYKYSVPINVQGPLINHKESFLNLTFYYVFY